MLASGDALTTRHCPAGATFRQRRLTKSVDSCSADYGQNESNIFIDAMTSSGRRQQVDDPLDRGVGAVISGFEAAIGAGLRCWPVPPA